MDKDIQRLQEVMAAVRSEKEALEAVLFDTQTNLEASEEKKIQLEKEVQDLLVKQEQLKSQVIFFDYYQFFSKSYAIKGFQTYKRA